ncbi:MAG: hypothetical protein HQL37_08470, partial [Alphaproteobacteria bacterium]|nr:hypothetical protein [Alphaproteobacteria bacterium]
MSIRKTLKATALASMCLAPFAAVAQDEGGFELSDAKPSAQGAPAEAAAQPAATPSNEVNVGVTGQSSTSAVFGRYNGRYSEGATYGGDVRLRGRDDWQSGTNSFYDFNARDLNFGMGSSGVNTGSSGETGKPAGYNLLPSATVDLNVGNQGTWKL